MLKITMTATVVSAIAAAVALVAAPAVPPAAGVSAGAPCEPNLSAPRPPSSKPKVPAAPTGVRIIKGGGGLEEPEPEGSGPFVPAESDEVADETMAGPHPYFDSLSLRTDCLAAYHMRSQAQLDAILTGAKNSPKKQPVTYDSAADAALFKMYGPSTTDSQQKLVELPINGNSMLLTWDFRFDENFKWVKAGYVDRHKAWRIDTADVEAWLAMKTDYARASNQGKGLAEIFMSVPSAKFLAPGATRGDREIPNPKLGEFFIEANSWARAWWLLEDLNQSICHVSLWLADEKRDPVQIYNRLPIYTTPGGLHPGEFRFEYDTSMDNSLNPVEMHSWNRNLVILQNTSLSAVGGLLKRP